jgi:Uma2 family endonuclease
MSAMTLLTKPARPFTRADLDAMPDDGYRYELLDGMLLVSAAPVPRHQVVSGNLHLLLRASCPPDLQVLYAPVDVVLADDTVLEPDLLVAPRQQFSAKDLPGAPLLAVEVLSPSTRRVDQLLKRDRYQEAGCPSYWLVDPQEPSVLALELEDGRYVERGRAAGTESLALGLPYPLTIVPADLLA